MPETTVETPVESKPFYTSRTLWVNALGIVWMMLNHFKVVNSPLTPETEATVLLVINMILRVLTKKEVTIS